MNILILGANGYLGSKITRLLIDKGHNIVCTRRDNSNLSRLNGIADKICFIEASSEAVSRVCLHLKFDYFLNLACNYGRSNVLYDNVIESNIEFPLKVLNILVENGTKKFLTIGTGLPDNFNMYSFTKKMFGQFGEFYVDKHNINFNVLSLEMFYGSDEPTDRFIPSIMIKMINGEDVDTTLGTQQRDIISIDDIVKAVMMIIEVSPRGYNEIPVGTGEAPTVSEIVDFIWNKTGKKSKIHKGAIPMRNSEPSCVANIEKISLLGEWNPINWKEGISKMIDDLTKD